MSGLAAVAGCPLCDGDGGPVLWRDGFCRIVRASSDDYPAFLRVILDRHVSEMTDLDEAARARLMRAVWAAERVVRDAWRPDKVNLASFGNLVPHLHWHVIARWADDAHFPDPSWGPPRRAAARRAPTIDDARLGARLAERLPPAAQDEGAHA